METEKQLPVKALAGSRTLALQWVVQRFADLATYKWITVLLLAIHLMVASVVAVVWYLAWSDRLQKARYARCARKIGHGTPVKQVIVMKQGDGGST